MAPVSPSKLLSLLCVATSVLAQRRNRSPEFIGSGLDIAEIAIASTVLLVFLTQGFLAFIGLTIVRGHRRPYAFLLLTLGNLIIAVSAFICIRVLNNTIRLDIPTHTLSALQGLNAFFGSWAQVSLFATIVLAMHDRINASDLARGKPPTNEDIKRRRIFWAVHGFFILLMFALGTAAAGAITSLLHDVEASRFISSSEIRRRANAANDVNYAFASFVIFTVFDVVALAVYLRGQFRDANIKDKITNNLVYFVTPLYVFSMVIFMAFTIVFSPAGITRTEDNLVRARIADLIVFNLVLAILITPLILYGFSRMKWETPGENHAQQWTVTPVQQPYYPQPMYYNQQPYYSPQQWPGPVQGQPPMQQGYPGQVSIPVGATVPGHQQQTPPVTGFQQPEAHPYAHQQLQQTQ